VIYDRPIWVLMQEAAAELSPPYAVGEIVTWFAERYPRIKASSVRAHVRGLTANDPSRHHYPTIAGMTALFVRQPDRSLLPFDAAGADADEAVGRLGDEPVPDEDSDARLSPEFVLEAHLEEFLAGNWASINWGRPLEIWEGPGGQSGHQLSTPVGRLDFLCIDQQAGALVVLELKRGRPSDRVVGQAARYMGYIRAHVADPEQSVEGLIVAHEAEDALRYAVAALPGLQVMTYQVNFQLSPLTGPTPQAGRDRERPTGNSAEPEEPRS
jgi:hypothetical protein